MIQNDHQLHVTRQKLREFKRACDREGLPNKNLPEKIRLTIIDSQASLIDDLEKEIKDYLELQKRSWGNETA